MPAHSLIRSLCAALLAASLALSCATQPPATAPQPAEPAPAPELQITPDGQPILPGEPLPETPIHPGMPDQGAVPPLPFPGMQQRTPIMALLLPLDSPDFRRAAYPFVRGVEAAALLDPAPLPVEVHATDASPEGIYQAYVEVLQQGPAVVVGPMTRSGVSAIASSGIVMVPTLTLNQPDNDQPLPPGLYAFGLSVEDEARMLAQRAYRDGMRRIGAVSTPAPLSHRSREAFLEEWRKLGGEAVSSLDASPQSDLTAMRAMLTEQALDAIYFAAQYEDARLIRPYLPSQVPVYATSQINSFPIDPVGMVDLNGVRFLDMPWLLSPDHESFVNFPRPADLSGGALRFYALGVDAYRIAAQLARGQHDIRLDGLTGRISVQPDGTVERRPWLAIFLSGEQIVLE